MSDTSVRAAVVAYFKTATIPGLSTIYKEYPWRMLQTSFNLGLQGGFGAVGVVHLIDSTESRNTFGGLVGTAPQGQKIVDHNIGLVLPYQYLVPSTLPAGTVEDAWIAPLDSIIDGVKSWIRQDPTMGTGAGGAIFQAGQMNGGIKITRDPAQLNEGIITVWNAVEFSLQEVITA